MEIKYIIKVLGSEVSPEFDTRAECVTWCIGKTFGGHTATINPIIK